MLNIIKSIIITTIYFIITTISFLRGPLLVGFISLVSILAITKNASAEVVAYQCNHVACPVLEGFSFSQIMGITMVILGVITAFFLSAYDKRKKMVHKKLVVSYVYCCDGTDCACGGRPVLDDSIEPMVVIDVKKGPKVPPKTSNELPF